MVKTPLVSIIIVNWNGNEILDKCLESVFKLKYPLFEIIVVDNGSTIKPTSKNGKVKFVYEKTNLGFAGGNNVGLKHTRGEYILLLNNDTEVVPDLLDKLVARLSKDPGLGAIQPKIFLMDEKGRLDNCGSYLSRIGFLEHWGFGKKDGPEFNSEKIIFSAKGACVLIKQEVIEKVGLFDNDFGSYFEESDFCWRVWLAGWKVVYYPKTQIYHKLAFTAKKLNPFSVNYHSYKNRINSLIKNLGTWNLILILPTHLAVVEVLSVYYLTKLHFGEAWIIQKAIWWNLRVLPRTLRKRRVVQKTIRKLNDEEIFEFILKPFKIATYLGYLVRLEKDFKERSVRHE